MKRAESLVRVARLRPSESELRLRLCGVHSVSPPEMLPQARREQIVAIYLFPASAPLCVTHRRLAGRTQMRHILQPGDLLVRTRECCEEWALSFAPLRAQDLAHGSADHTRRVAVFELEGAELRGHSEPVRFVVGGVAPRVHGG